MDTLHSLAELREHFDTVHARGCSAESHSTPSRVTCKAYPDSLPIGSIVDVDGYRAMRGYNKDHTLRPALVTALWRDNTGAIRKIEFSEITTNVKRIYPDDLLIGTPEQKRDFKRNKDAIVPMCLSYIVNNTFENFAVTHRKPFQIPHRYWEEIILRRADAILHSPGLRTEVQGSLAGLTREGIFFPNINEEHIYKTEFIPEVTNGGFGKKCWAGISSQRVNWLARFAEFYYQTQPSALQKTHQYPPMEEWPTSIPAIRFRSHNRKRDYAPALAAE